jgi:hypothetical protein
MKTSWFLKGSHRNFAAQLHALALALALAPTNTIMAMKITLEVPDGQRPRVATCWLLCCAVALVTVPYT